MRLSLHWKSLLLGLLATQKIKIGGDIYFGEILALVYVLSNYRLLIIGKSLRPVLWLALVWAGCQVISDFVNGTAWLDSVKGVGAPVVFATSITALSMVWSRDISRMPSFLLGMYAGSILGYVLFPNEYFQGNPWKWGVGLVVLGAFSIIFSFFAKKRSSLVLLTCLLLFLVVSLWNDARSMAVFPLLAGIAYLAVRSGRLRLLIRRLQGRFGVVKLASVVVVLMIVMNTAFTMVFSSSWFLQAMPQASAEKFRKQASGNYGVLLGGRTETLVSVDAYLKKPLLGHGSWAKDKDGYRDLLAERVFQAGYSDNPLSTNELNLIPVHSYLIGGLVWAGIGGGLFWLYLIFWLMRQFISQSEYLGFYFYNGIVALMWNILFSPFGADARWATAVFVASLCVQVRWIAAWRRNE